MSNWIVFAGSLVFLIAVVLAVVGAVRVTIGWRRFRAAQWSAWIQATEAASASATAGAGAAQTPGTTGAGATQTPGTTGAGATLTPGATGAEVTPTPGAADAETSVSEVSTVQLVAAWVFAGVMISGLFHGWLILTAILLVVSGAIALLADQFTVTRRGVQ